jgi:hypothetical protein
MFWSRQFHKLSVGRNFGNQSGFCHTQAVPKVPPFLEGASCRSVTELERVYGGNIFKRTNACLDAKGQNFVRLL